MAEYDVVVCGGGPGGFPAAIAAARLGRRVLLIEKQNHLGGVAASGLGILGYLDRNGHRILGGIPWEFLERMTERGASRGVVKCPVHNSLAPIDCEEAKFVAQQMCEEAGVDILLHTWCVSAVMENDRVTGVKVHNKSGGMTVRGKVVVDATGDGDVAASSGAAYEIGDAHGRLQPATLVFRVANVDVDQVLSYVEQHPEEIALPESYTDVYDVSYFRSVPVYCFIGLPSLVKQAIQDKVLTSPRDRFIFITSPRKGEVTINNSRILGVDSTNAANLSQAELAGRRQVMELMEFFHGYVPGFQEAQLIDTADELGLRESRRFKGLYKLSKQDVVSGASFPDGIGKGGYSIDIHDKDGASITLIGISSPYDIPYGCLVPEKTDGLILSGRCISVDPDAFGSTRVMGTCMAVGEAAGTAAALASQSGIQPREVDRRTLVRQLTLQKAIVTNNPD